MQKVYGYVRVSTIKQGTKGVSLQEQRTAIQQYAEKNNLKIAEWFEEKETAAKRGRSLFTQMLKQLRQGKAFGVVIHKIDRSARNLKDWADLGELIDAGVNVYFAHEGLDLHARGGRLSADIQAVIAADYVRNLKEEIRKGFYGRLKQGIYPLNAPLGYLDMGGGKVKKPDPVTAPLIKQAFNLYATNTYTLETLLSKLTSLGLRNKKGRKLSLTGISTILNNPFYMGLIRIRKTNEIFQGKHEPIISKSLFDKVQVIITGKTNTRIQKHDLLFRRMLTCIHCRYSLIGEVQKGITYYRCHTKGCLTKCLRGDYIHDEVKKIIHKTQLPKDVKQELVKIANTDNLAEKANRATQKKTIKLNLGRINSKLDRLTDAFIDGDIDKKLFEQRKYGLLMEQKLLEENLSKYSKKDKLENTKTNAGEYLEQENTYYSQYISGFLEEKRDILKKSTSNLTVDGKNVVVELRKPFNRIAECVTSYCCAQQRGIPRIFGTCKAIKCAEDIYKIIKKTN